MNVVKSLISLLILPLIASAQTLHLKNYEIKPDSRTAAALTAPGPRWTAGRSHLILQFRHPVNDRIVHELNERGAFVVGAVPDFGVAVSALDTFSIDGLDLAWAGRLDAAYKISPLLEHPAAAEGWFVVELFPDVDQQDARRMAEAAGFEVHRHPDLIKSHMLLSGDPNRLPGFVQWDEVAYVFPASNDLINGVHVHACAGALSTGGVVGTYATSETGWPKDANGDGEVTLSYVFGDLTPKLDPAQTTQAILQALNSWTPYAPFKLVAGTSATAPRTINIFFAEGDHGDGYPFDGPGGVLAHTFYPAPPNSEPIAGDMHFDGSEDWHIGADTDLFTVALHEAGHALGLAHVDDPAQLMYPYYRLGVRIAPGDIAAVQALYSGSASAPAASSSPTPATPSLTLTIATPSANATTAAATIQVTGTTSGGTGTVQVTWQVGQGASGTATGSTQWSIAAVPLAVGSNTITITAADSSHKVVETVTVTRSATPVASAAPPVIAITSPATATFNTLASTITGKGTASDSAGVTKVTWQSAGYSGTAAGTTSWSASSIPLLVGNNIVTLRAYDAAGNQTSKSILVVRK